MEPDPTRHELDAYASHISVGFGFSENVTTKTIEKLPPLRSPKLSAGGFYLQPPENPHHLSGNNDPDHVIRAHWGSAADPKGKPRKMRGRKYYWHGQESAALHPRVRHRFSRRMAQDGGKASTVPPGTTITARVRFNNLTASQLATLLAAADPSRLISTEDGHEAPTILIHLGRGKPLGFGSVEPAIKHLTVFTAAERYAPDSEATGGAVRWENDLATDRADLRRCRQALIKVLQSNSVHADRIWYPTIKRLDQRPDHDALFRAFYWFQDHSGSRAQQGLTPLPDVFDWSQYLPNSHDQQGG